MRPKIDTTQYVVLDPLLCMLFLHKALTCDFVVQYITEIISIIIPSSPLDCRIDVAFILKDCRHLPVIHGILLESLIVIPRCVLIRKMQ